MQGACFHWFGSRSRAGFTVPATRVHYHRAHTWCKLWSRSWNSQFLNKGPFTFILYYAWQVTRPVLSKCLVCSQMLTLSRWLFFLPSPPSNSMPYMLDCVTTQKTIEKDSSHSKLFGHCGNRTLFKQLNHYIDNSNRSPAWEDMWGNSQINQKVLHTDLRSLSKV